MTPWTEAPDRAALLSGLDPGWTPRAPDLGVKVRGTVLVREDRLAHHDGQTPQRRPHTRRERSTRRPDCARLSPGAHTLARFSFTVDESERVRRLCARLGQGRAVRALGTSSLGLQQALDLGVRRCVLDRLRASLVKVETGLVPLSPLEHAVLSSAVAVGRVSTTREWRTDLMGRLCTRGLLVAEDGRWRCTAAGLAAVGEGAP